MMPYVTTGPILLFLLLSHGGKRVGTRELGACFAAIAGGIAMTGVALLTLERNLGPHVVFASMILCAVSVALLLAGTAGAGRLHALGRWLGRPVVRSWMAKVHIAGIAIAVGLVFAATARRAGGAAPEPDLEPLVSQSATSFNVETAGLHVTSGTKKVDPTSYWPDTCIVTIIDDNDKTPHEIRIDASQVMSGSVLCPIVDITIDPSRHIVYLRWSTIGWLGGFSMSDAWRLPAFTPTSTAKWTCRLGALRAAPREWLVAAWIGVACAVAAGGFAAWVGRGARRRFRGAREGSHLGDGVVSLSGDAGHTTIPDAARLDVGPITVLGSTELPVSGYRAGRSIVGGVLFPSTLAELTEPHARREAYGHVLGLLALSFGAAPLVAASFAGLVL